MKKIILYLIFVPFSILVMWMSYGYTYESYDIFTWDSWYKLCFIFTTTIGSITVFLTIKDHE